jgi:hypothetical protein
MLSHELHALAQQSLRLPVTLSRQPNKPIPKSAAYCDWVLGSNLALLQARL